MAWGFRCRHCPLYKPIHSVKTLAQRDVPEIKRHSPVAATAHFSQAANDFGTAGYGKPYTFRHYSQTQSYLGFSSQDQHVYFLSAPTSLVDLGAASTWAPLAACP